MQYYALISPIRTTGLLNYTHREPRRAPLQVTATFVKHTAKPTHQHNIKGNLQSAARTSRQGGVRTGHVGNHIRDIEGHRRLIVTQVATITPALTLACKRDSGAACQIVLPARLGD